MLGRQLPLPMTKVADHLVGRAAELEAIDRAVGELCDGRTAPLVIQGEPGIGKTRLLAELAERADARGCTVLGGSASELERDLPFWVFVDALDEYVAGLDPRLVASLRDEVRSELAHVLPSLSDPTSGGGAVAQDERYRAHRAVRELVERLAASKPLVLALDDVHWADAASVELLTALLRSPPDAAVPGRDGRTPASVARSPRYGSRAGRPPGRPGSPRAGWPRSRGGRRAPRRRRRARAGGRALLGGGRQPVLPPAARSLGRRRGRRAVAARRSGAGGRRRARGGDRVAGRGARAAVRRHSPGAVRRGRVGRPVRARSRRRRGRRERRRGDGGVRRAARSRPRALHRRPAAVSLP